MKRIQPAKESVRKLLGRQKRDPLRKYRISKYCVRIPVDEGVLFFQTLTGELWLSGHDECPEDNMDELIGSWFYVPVDFDEQRQTDELRSLARILWKKKNKTQFTILTTTDCNARCFYCYEMGAKRFPMSDGTAEDVANYIAQICGGEGVKISWFGGEPLYNRKAIEIITSQLRKKGIGFSSNMTTNGYYLDEETVKTAVKDWNLKKVQISLDGTKEVYKKAKAYIEKDEDPLARVLGNIASALQSGLIVYIRLNMDRRNADDLLKLADQLAERFPEKKNLNVYVSILEEFTGSIHEFSEKNEEKDKTQLLIQRLKEHGLLNTEEPPKSLRIYRCMADQDSYEVIMPDGSLISCEHFNMAEPIGCIDSTQRDAAVQQAWKETVSYPECEDCPLYPGCINLKKCPWVKESCHEVVRAKKMKELESSVLAVYNQWKTNWERTESNENE